MAEQARRKHKVQIESTVILFHNQTLKPGGAFKPGSATQLVAPPPPRDMTTTPGVVAEVGYVKADLESDYISIQFQHLKAGRLNTGSTRVLLPPPHPGRMAGLLSCSLTLGMCNRLL